MLVLDYIVYKVDNIVCEVINAFQILSTNSLNRKPKKFLLNYKLYRP